VRGGCVVVILLALCFSVVAQTNATRRVAAVAAQLESEKDSIAAGVMARLKTNRLDASYTVVWRQFEDAAIDALCEILPQQIPGLSESDLDRGQTGREKNRLADLAVRVGEERIEISIKAARASANPENDLGTFRDHPNRRRLFAASFTLWVRYDDSGGGIHSDRVFFDRSWRFVGKSSLVDGVKYRKKGGNLRPKPWTMFDSGEAFWKTEDEFEAAVTRAELYRANELIKEYLDDLSESDQRLLYEKLKRQFESPAPTTR
jgi:hypothetical protein